MTYAAHLPDLWGSPGAWAVAAAYVVGLGIRLYALGFVPRGRKPSTAMAWMLLILTWPLPGLLVFRLFGSTRLGRKRHQRHRAAHEAVERRTKGLPRLLEGLDAPAYVRSVARLNRRLGALPVLGGNAVDLLDDYAGSIAAMTAAVERAEREVRVQFYITAWDDLTGPFFEALLRATDRGVRVRLLFDHLGSRGLKATYPDLVRRLGESDVEWRAMLPIHPLQRRWRRPDLRNHRKIVTVDGRVGFMGSQNLTEPGYNKAKNHALGREWVELMVRIEGPTVAALDAVFAGDWYVETAEVLDVEVDTAAVLRSTTTAVDDVLAQVVPSGPGYAEENNLRMFTTLVYGAQRRLSLTSPYFVPDESLLYAVTTAAQRGVDVELFVSEVSDQFMVGHAQASYYETLLEAGVRIHLYPAPAILHSKHFTVDDDVAVIGSSNMDMRSFALNYEVSMMLLGGDVVRRFREVEDAYRAVSRPLTGQEWAGRRPGARFVDNVMRLTSSLQ